MSGRATPATSAADQAGVDYTLHPYEHHPRGAASYGLEAAAALGVPPERVFKTLIASVDDGLVVAVLPVDRQLDLKALARAAGGKRAGLAEPSQAQRATGYLIGGISPLGQRARLPTVLDASAGRHERIYVSAGRRGLQMELAPADLARLTGASQADIAT